MISILNRRSFSTLKDSLRVTEELKKFSGLKDEQIKDIMNSINRIVDVNLQLLDRHVIKREDFERELNEKRLDLHKLVNDSMLARSREQIQAHANFDQLLRDLRIGRQKCRESLLSLKSELRLNSAVEKSKLRDGAVERDLRLQNFRAKVDGEVGNCLAAVEKMRHDIFYSLTGFFFTSAAALLGYLRFFS